MYGIELTYQKDGTLILALNRPELHNAFDEHLIDSLTRVLSDIADDDRVRVVCLKGNGKSFSAGADLNWMRRMADYGREDNLRDARALAEMLRALNALPRTTIALIQGAAMGGGVGLASCCDIVVAADDTRFSLSEVRLGLIPSVISPYVLAAIGQRQGRRLMQSGERFDAAMAHHIGLVHEVVAADQLEQRGQTIINELLKCGPNAQRAAKELVFNVAGKPVEDDIVDYTSNRIADIRASEEGRDGVSAFLQKRKPGWLI